MSGSITLQQKMNIIELGPGCGVITSEIIKRMPDDAQLFCIEKNKCFATKLSQHFSMDSVTILNASAEELDRLLPEYVTKIDCIVSSLPLSIFPQLVKRRIIHICYSMLKENGQFIQMQYTFREKRMIEQHLKHNKTLFCLLNVPPAFVFSTHKESRPAM